MGKDLTVELLDDGDRISAKITLAWTLGGYVQRVEFGADTAVRAEETTEDALDRLKGIATDATFSLVDEISEIYIAKARSKTATATDRNTN